MNLRFLLVWLCCTLVLSVPSELQITCTYSSALTSDISLNWPLVTSEGQLTWLNLTSLEVSEELVWFSFPHQLGEEQCTRVVLQELWLNVFDCSAYRDNQFFTQDQIWFGYGVSPMGEVYTLDLTPNASLVNVVEKQVQSVCGWLRDLADEDPIPIVRLYNQSISINKRVVQFQTDVIWIDSEYLEVGTELKYEKTQLLSTHALTTYVTVGDKHEVYVEWNESVSGPLTYRGELFGLFRVEETQLTIFLEQQNGPGLRLDWPLTGNVLQHVPPQILLKEPWLLVVQVEDNKLHLFKQSHQTLSPVIVFEGVSRAWVMRDCLLIVDKFGRSYLSDSTFSKLVSAVEISLPVHIAVENVGGFRLIGDEPLEGWSTM